VLICSKIFSQFFRSLFFRTRRLWIKQRSSLANRTVVTKLQFTRIKQNMFTSADEEQRHLMKMIREWTKIANIMHLTREETQIPKGCLRSKNYLIRWWVNMWRCRAYAFLTHDICRRMHEMTTENTTTYFGHILPIYRFSKYSEGTRPHFWPNFSLSKMRRSVVAVAEWPPILRAEKKNETPHSSRR